MVNYLISLIVLGIINDSFCDALNDINNAICITATTTVESLYCGELSIEDAYTITNEIMDDSWHQILWDKKYRLIDIDTLKYFLDDNWIKEPHDGDWFDCDDYARILLRS